MTKRDSILLTAVAALLLLAGAVAFLLQEEDGSAIPEPSGATTGTQAPDEGAHRTGPSRGGGTPETEDPGPLVPVEPAEPGDELGVPAPYSAHLIGRVSAPDDRAVAGCLIAVCRDLSALARQSQQGDVVATAESDADGRYEVLDLPTGDRYLIRAEHSEFASKIVPTVELEPGEKRVLDLRLDEGLAISGFVRDGAGLPLEDAEIVVLDQARRGTGLLANMERTARTDANGAFRVEHLNAGYKRVMAWKKPYAARFHPTVFIRPGREVDPIELVLESGFTISGRVIDDGKGGVAGAILVAQKVIDPGNPDVQGALLPIESDEDGSFVYEGLAEGAYNVQATKDGYASFAAQTRIQAGSVNNLIRLKRNPVVRGRAVDESTGSGLPRFTVTLSRQPNLLYSAANTKQSFESENGEFEFSYPQTGHEFYLFVQASGYALGRSELIQARGERVVEDVVIAVGKGAVAEGRVVDAAGEPVAGANVRLAPTKGGEGSDDPLARMLFGSLRAMDYAGRTDADGRYRIETLSEGTYRVHADHVAFARQEAEQTFEVPRQGEVRVPDLVLIRGGVVTGVVLDAAGKASANATVKLSRAGQGAGAAYTVSADGAGRFTITNVAPGVYLAEAVRTDGGPTDIFGLLGEAKHRPQVTVADGATVEVTLR